MLCVCQIFHNKKFFKCRGRMDEKIADGIIVGGHMERYTTYFGVHLKFFKTKFFLNLFFIFFIFLRTAVCSSMLPQDEAPCAPRPQPHHTSPGPSTPSVYARPSGIRSCRATRLSRQRHLHASLSAPSGWRMFPPCQLRGQLLLVPLKNHL